MTMRDADDRAVELLIGRLLQAGVLVAAIVVSIGGVLLLVREGHTTADYSSFRGAPASLRTVRGIVTGAIALEPRAVAQLGLLLLLATPVARVALTLVAFVRQRDRLYVAITTVVLTLLLIGVTGGG